MKQTDEIDLSNMLEVLKQGKKTILYITLTGFLLSIIYIFNATPYYKSYISHRHTSVYFLYE